MPSCYMLCACAGSSIDQQSNNVSLFNLVEQVQVMAHALHGLKAVLPIEAHAHWQFSRDELNREVEVRYVMINATTELETASETMAHRIVTLRMRSRLFGIPLPPVADDYSLGVDWRWTTQGSWQRERQRWPLRIRVATAKPKITH